VSRHLRAAGSLIALLFAVLAFPLPSGVCMTARGSPTHALNTSAGGTRATDSKLAARPNPRAEQDREEAGMSRGRQRQTAPQAGRAATAPRSAADWWGRGIALAALVVAGLSLLVSYLQWRDAQARAARHLDVALSLAPVRVGGVSLPPGLQLRAENRGYQPVTVATGGVRLPGGESVLFDADTEGWRYPHVIAPGDNATTHLSGSSLARLCDVLACRGFSGVVALVGFYTDALGHTYLSEELLFDMPRARMLLSPPAGAATTPKPGQ
jgi:hypothetical protein